MKTITLLFIFAFISISISSQTNIDSLCNTYNKRNEDRRYAIKYAHYNFDYRVEYDENTKKNIKRYGYHNDIYNGWYYIDKPAAVNEYIVPASMIGVHNTSYQTGWYQVHIYAIGCFDHGVPCCTWEYTLKWNKKETDEEKKKQAVNKTESYTDGIIDGQQLYERLYNGKIVDILYMTTFKMGTGYYKDFYPDGSLRIEGKLVDGYREGEWREYDRENGKLNKIIVTEYEKALFKRDREYYYPSSYTDEEIRKAVEWERQPANLKKEKENPYLEYE
ncbi:hypothetical protein M2451_003837 [Dysgonomonas sp. PFB1-18]|uniref:hypothetical protein n=1 Tax=unclassified Dysgonomonas TaxID=2630389 RepID=UPI002475A2D7|nr:MULTISPECIES: hypothetical protein [unclassified Dysgonomonas]MDH6309481.1 hypothetical protein [Dysgonomonas sp. PF1-14]MDH6340891.1 hypothetical protein [Dysgonomonas sp. PF1-16]MDH6382496.1 hypothetical protein [Dysgonomonas sp. PFB1-18]MDH6399860.1 hypothetical protein [Dysgonomonas sp. PF1-23]